jgi:hypothetical protein
MLFLPSIAKKSTSMLHATGPVGAQECHYYAANSNLCLPKYT